MSKRNQQIYDNLTDIFSIIFAFSRLKILPIAGEFGDDVRLASDRITIQNLISLCALTRNFIEGTKSISLSKSISIKLLEIDYKASHREPSYSTLAISLYQAMSRIIHSVNLDIATDTASLRPFPRDIVDAYEYVRSRKPINPVIFCETESDSACRFKLTDFLDCVHNCVNLILEKDDIDGLLPRNIRDA